jgi:hypothetical protein
MAEQWLSIVEYARTYKISDMTVRRRIKTGRLEAVLQDGKYYIPIKPTTVPKTAALKPNESRREEAVTTDFAPSMFNDSMNRNAEIQIIKGHPTARTVYPETPAQPLAATAKGLTAFSQISPTASITKDVVYPVPSTASSAHHEVGEKVIPSSLRQSLIQYETSLIDSKALISFCESALRKVQDGERKTYEKFKSKLETLEATIGAKDQEIKSLRQQLEDLQLLVKILERRKSAG